MERYRVLIVDDDITVRKMLGQFLGSAGFAVDLAGSAEEAIARMEQAYFDAVLTDVQMPDRDGLELLDWITARRQEIATVMLSGSDDARLAVRAMQGGALDYLVKPLSLGCIGSILAKAVGKRRESLGSARYLQELESTLQQQAGELRDTLSQLQESSEETLEALVTALDVREQETRAHSKRVSDYSVQLATALGIAGPNLETIRQGSMLHDIGKIGIPDRILLKPEPLTPEEWAEMRKHPQIGAWILGGVESLKSASHIVISHHERFDGTGYPAGLRGEKIPLGARIFAVADTLDAVLSDRPYRTGRDFEQARNEIAQNARTQFDPAVVNSFLSMPAESWLMIRDRSLVRAARAERA